MMATEIFPGAVKFDFPEDLAKEIIKDVNKSKKTWTDSAIGGGDIAKHVRSSLGFDLDTLSISKDKIRPLIYECVKQYSSYYDIQVTGDEGLGLLKYESYDKYEFHVDHGPGLNRAVSCLIYLNPGEYDGGGTTFKHFNYTINPDRPALVLFPSNYPYLHAADPISRGKKYIIVTWMTDKIDNLLNHGPGCTCGR
jgi:predicted 2-oxoglutarate/Fe(II)-dependent dioxygenase YbiX